MVLSWLLSHKLLTFLIIATTAFTISTIVLGVENSNLRAKVDDLESEMTSTETPTTPTTTPTTTPASTTTQPPEDMSKYRLPTTAKPLVYDLYLYPDLETGLFTGRVIVSLDILAETNSIVLHSNLLTIDNVTVDSSPTQFDLDQTYEILTVTKADGSTFAVGNTNLDINFNGDMKDRIVGLYTSSYTTSSGESR